MRRFALVAATALAACSGASQAPLAGGALPQTAPVENVSATTTPIKHVVVIIQENRSFDNFFSTFPGADGATEGKNSSGGYTPLTKSNLIGPDMAHGHPAFVVDYDGGKMDGFDKAKPVNGQPAGDNPYHYVDPTQILPYWTLAKQYILLDHMFPTQGSGSFTAHQDLIAGGTAINDTESVIDDPSNEPWGCDAPPNTVTTLISTAGHYMLDKGPFPCFSYPTLRDVLDAKHVNWRFYAPPDAPGQFGSYWSAFDAIRAVRRGPEWRRNVISPETQILSDVPAGKLMAVTWVVPDLQNSDHPGIATDGGPSWVAQVVNAIGKSPYWDSTAIVIVWDDWGGFYDNVKPPQLDAQGLGFRVPAIIVSPYTKTGVAHTQYEYGSILRFIEDNWSLGRIRTTDVRATSIANCFKFDQKPRAFTPVAAKYSRAYFEHQKPSGLPVDTE